MQDDIHPIEMAILITLAMVWAITTLARAFLRLLAGTGTPPEPHQPVATITPPEPPPLAELAILREQLMAETAATLRQITGNRRRCSKAEMVATFLAMPV